MNIGLPSRILLISTFANIRYLPQLRFSWLSISIIVLPLKYAITLMPIASAELLATDDIAKARVDITTISILERR